MAVVAPQGARISVHNVYGETLVEAHAPAHAVTLQIGGYGHGVYIVSVTSSAWSSWPCQYISDVPSVIFLNWFL